MKSKLYLHLPASFIVKEKSLGKLIKLLNERIGEVEITAKCSDDITRVFKDVSSLASFENSREKRINLLDISAESDDRENRASIEFSSESYPNGIYIRATAQDDIVTNLRNDICEIIDGLKPWYHILSKTNFFIFLYAFGAFYFLLIFGLFFALERGWTSTRYAETIAKSPVTTSFLLVSSAVCVPLLAYIATRLQQILFPQAIFLLGQEIVRYETLEKIRWGFVIAFIASFLSGIVLLAFQ